LKAGKTIGLISDAGTPGISDPGAALIHEAIACGIKVEAIPGACAAIVALTSSGLNTDCFQFVGFLPKKSSEVTRKLKEILQYTGTTVCYESPHRLLEILKTIETLDPKRPLCIARELTKKFEEILRGSAPQLLQRWKDDDVKGEIVLLISGHEEQEAIDWSTLSPASHVNYMIQTFGLTRQEAIVAVAKIRSVSKRDIYNEIHQK
jgi:16S rRNA (cytidine1402-2'-O)-methyltransferase